MAKNNEFKSGINNSILYLYSGFNVVSAGVYRYSRAMAAAAAATLPGAFSAPEGPPPARRADGPAAALAKAPEDH